MTGLRRPTAANHTAPASTARVSRQQRPAPRPMAGTVVIAPNRRQRIARPLNVAPTRTNLAAILAGEALAHDLHAAGFPADLAGQNAMLVELCDPLVLARAAELDRRGVSFLEAAARFLVTHHRHAWMRFLPRGDILSLWRDHTATTRAISETSGHAGTADLDEVDQAASLPALARRRRVLWMHPDGPAAGLLVDRIHHTPRSGLIEVDTWMRRKVAEDLHRVTNLLVALGGTAPGAPSGSGEDAAEHGILGVRVFTHRAPNAGVHFTATLNPAGQAVVADHHRIGGCHNCLSTSHTTTSQTQPAAPEDVRAAVRAEVAP